MLPAPLVTLAWLTSSVMAFKRTCLNEFSAEQVNSQEAAFAAAQRAAVSPKILGIFDQPLPTEIPVHFHTIFTNTSAADGYVNATVIVSQIDVLNKGFAKTGLTFKLVNITRTRQVDWFNSIRAGSKFEYDMKNTLRVGGANALNIYSVGYIISDKPDTSIVGLSTVPWGYSRRPKRDGVILLHTSLPGGTPPRNLGHTAIHEVGHWAGLYHTFQGGCSLFGDGDRVSDTPKEASAAYGCPVGRNSCPIHRGEDPIHNFMDYSDDSCTWEFTPGQITRMRSMCWVYRNIKLI